MMPATSQLLTIDPGGLTVIVDISDRYAVSITSYTADGGATSHTLPKTISTPTAFWITEKGAYTVSAKIGQAEVGGETVELAGTPITYRVNPVTAADMVAAFRQVAPTINAQTETTYTLAATDVLVTLSNAEAITLTVPKNATAAFPIGARVTCIQTGAGLVTAAAESGATVGNVHATLNTLGQHSVIYLDKVSTNGWTISGDLAAS